MAAIKLHTCATHGYPAKQLIVITPWVCLDGNKRWRKLTKQFFSTCSLHNQKNPITISAKKKEAEIVIYLNYFIHKIRECGNTTVILKFSDIFVNPKLQSCIFLRVILHRADLNPSPPPAAQKKQSPIHTHIKRIKKKRGKILVCKLALCPFLRSK